MNLEDNDRALRRFERDAVLACLATALVGLGIGTAAFGVARGLNVGLGVLGGGLLMAVSYRSIKGGVDVLAAVAVQAGLKPRPTEEGHTEESSPDCGATNADAQAPDGGRAGLQPCQEAPVLSPGRRILLVVKYFTRYALLAVAAYVMLTCFRLHPVGVVAGALAPFLAGVMQVGRLSRARARRQHP